MASSTTCSIPAAAQLLEGKHPLAATLLRRAMIERTLNGAKSTRDKHAVRHLLECASLAPAIADAGPFGLHQAFMDRLRAKHGRKAGFWVQVKEAAAGPEPRAPSGVHDPIERDGSRIGSRPVTEAEIERGLC